MAHSTRLIAPAISARSRIHALSRAIRPRYPNGVKVSQAICADATRCVLLDPARFDLSSQNIGQFPNVRSVMSEFALARA